MSEPATDLRSEIEQQLASLIGSMRADIARVTAHVDINDLDQVKLANAELDRVFEAGTRRKADIYADAMIKHLVLKPLIDWAIDEMRKESTGVRPGK